MNNNDSYNQITIGDNCELSSKIEFKLYQVLLPINYASTFTYSSENEYKEGDCIQVNFRNKSFVGIVWGHGSEYQDYNKIKAIESNYSQLTLSPVLCKFIKQVANYYIENAGEVLGMVLPNIDNKFITKYLPKYIEEQKFDIKYPELNSEQQKIFDEIIYKLDKDFSVHLIDGVTGSGKTEVYFSLAMRLIENTDKQVLIMLPEISLTTQLIDRFKKRFGIEPIIWHSSVGTKKRKQNLAMIINGNARVIIGARSSLFLPYKKLGLIIVDEEHDHSYKQEEGVCYNARDMAVLRASLENILVLLCSATLSIESLVNAKSGKYYLHKLDGRYSKVSLPEIKVADMRGNKVGFLSESLKKMIRQTLDKSKQVMLFINRRGYSPLTICTCCGLRMACPDCSSWLVKHSKKNVLICHHCGYTENIPNNCPSCDEPDPFIYMGPGVERIAEDVMNYFPDARLVTISKDEVANNEQFRSKLQSFAEGKTNVIIGTQMVTKGFHFPLLELVGVIDADMSLRNNDFRAAEKTYQLLEQVSGRAGRENDRGMVVLQTYNPDSPIIKMLQSREKDVFYDFIINERANNKLPPFSRMIAMVFSDFNEVKVRKFADEVFLAIPKNQDVTVYGPAPAEMYKLRMRYRYRLLFKSNKSFNLQEFIRNLLASIKKPASIRIKIDVDPLSFY